MWQEGGTRREEERGRAGAIASSLQGIAGIEGQWAAGAWEGNPGFGHRGPVDSKGGLATREKCTSAFSREPPSVNQ